MSKDDKAKIQAVRHFLGVLQYLAHYIPCNAAELRPLYELTKSTPPTANTTDGPDAADIKDTQDNPAKAKASPRTRAKFVWTQAAEDA